MSAKPLPSIRPGALDARCEALRAEVRAFLSHELAGHPARLRAKNWSENNPAFSAKLGARGWIGMTWPKRFGGAARSHLERYVVIEELLAAGAPVGAHWVADRQSGPMLMRYSPEVWAPQLCPGIARGEIFFCIGMSEPDSGSDLASVRSRARRVDGGWRLNGRKLWTSRAHVSHYMIALFRSGDASQSRHGGLSQFLVDLNTPSITIRPVINQLGEHEFNEVTFDDVFLADACLLGEEGRGWEQVTAELSFERSGPERYLSSTQLLLEMIDLADPGSEREAIALGRLTAHLASLRGMSLGVSGMLARGDDPMLAATIVKDVGTSFEQSLPAIAHDLFAGRDALPDPFEEVLRQTTLAAPSFSLRGGTREILRGIIARGLGLR
jgi:acyl-CoA dehydrogenase